MKDAKNVDHAAYLITNPNYNLPEDAGVKRGGKQNYLVIKKSNDTLPPP